VEVFWITHKQTMMASMFLLKTRSLTDLRNVAEEQGVAKLPGTLGTKSMDLGVRERDPSRTQRNLRIISILGQGEAGSEGVVVVEAEEGEAQGEVEGEGEQGVEGPSD
jgi:hypothetical protein